MAMVLFQSDMMPIFGTHITIATRAVIWTFFDVMVFTIIGWFSKVLIALYSFWVLWKKQRQHKVRPNFVFCSRPLLPRFCAWLGFSIIGSRRGRCFALGGNKLVLLLPQLLLYYYKQGKRYTSSWSLDPPSLSSINRFAANKAQTRPTKPIFKNGQMVLDPLLPVKNIHRFFSQGLHL